MRLSIGWTAAICISSAMLLVAGCGSTGTSGSGGTQKMTMVYWEGSIASIPSWVADSEGIYKKNGLDVKLVPVTSGGASVSGGISGAFTVTDGAAADLTFPVIEQGEHIKGLVNYMEHNYYELIARSGLSLPNKDKPYPENLQDLKGKIVGVTGLGAFTDKMLRGLLADAHLTNQVKIVPVGVGQTAISALNSGKIDAYTAYPPLPSTMDAQNIKYQVIMSTDNFPARYKSYLLNHLVTTQNEIDSQPKLIKNFCTASSDALKWMQDPANFDALKKLVNKHLPGLPDAILTKGLHSWLKVFSPNGRITPNLIEHSNQVLLAQGAIKKPLKTSDYVASDSVCPH